MTENQRKWAIEEIEANILPDACDEVAERALVYAIEALSQPERPKGRWELIGKTENGANILQCSNCKRIRRGSVKSAFCRDCGADMRKEK